MEEEKDGVELCRGFTYLIFGWFLDKCEYCEVGGAPAAAVMLLFSLLVVTYIC